MQSLGSLYLMNRRQLVVLVASSLVAAARAVEAQPPPGKTARVGFLGDVPPFLDAAFRQGFRDLGYVEGQNLVIKHRFPGWKYERLPELAADLVRSRVDVIVAASPPAAMAARRATSTIPIVFAVSGDPVAEGFVASLAKPGGNITGLATGGPDLVGKQLEMLKAVVPRVSRVAVLQNPDQQGHVRAVPEARDAARALGIELHGVKARNAPEIDTAFAAMASRRMGGLLVLRDAVFRAHRDRIVRLAAEKRLPAVYGLKEEAEAGGLLAYGASVPELFRRVATYVDKILKGAKPADLPVEQPTKYELVINMKTARALGLAIPRELLLRADRVIY